MKYFKLSYTLLFLLTIACLNSNHSDKKVIEEFYSNGNIKSRSEIRNGMRNGLIQQYRENGQLQSSTEYKDDKRQGLYIEYSEKNNKIMLKAHFKDDKQDGEIIQYYQEGMLFRISQYKDNHLNDTMKTYWPDGKLKSENYYKMDTFTVGLKEYDAEGKLLKQPSILVKELNQLAIANKIILQISLTDKNLKATYYLDDLIAGKYLNPRSYKIAMKDGVGNIEFQVAPGKTTKQKIGIIAKVQTKYGNTLILNTSYNLSVTNRY